jgi:hypothetical protein
MMTDNDLRGALKRRQPPDGFAERAMGRAARGRRTRSSAWVAFALAASMVLAAGGAQIVLHQREVAAERAAEKLTLALRITSDTLRDVQEKVLITSQRVENLHDDPAR